MTQSGSRCSQGCARRDDIIDNQDTPTSKTGPGRKPRPMKALRARPTGLGRGTTDIAFEQPAARKPQLSRDVACDELSLIEPSLSPARCTCWRPCDNVEAEMITVRDDAIHDEAREVAGYLTAIVVLEPQDDRTSAPGIRHRGVHAMTSWLRQAANQGKTARRAHGSARGVTACATNLKQHVSNCDEGVS
jgi:hypothetical protein